MNPVSGSVSRRTRRDLLVRHLLVLLLIVRLPLLRHAEFTIELLPKRHLPKEKRNEEPQRAKGNGHLPRPPQAAILYANHLGARVSAESESKRVTMASWYAAPPVKSAATVALAMAPERASCSERLVKITPAIVTPQVTPKLRMKAQVPVASAVSLSVSGASRARSRVGMVRPLEANP